MGIRATFLAFVALLALPLVAAGEQLSLQQTLARLRSDSPQLAQSAAKIEAAQARSDEARAIMYPKIKALFLAAPMYTIAGSPLANDVTRSYKRIQDWGPYLHFDATIIQPLYAFGRISRAKNAAANGVKLEEARLAALVNAQLADASSLFYTIGFARHVTEPLAKARGWIEEAATEAQSRYAKADGSVSQADLQRLAYATAQLNSLEADIRLGEQDARQALQVIIGHTGSSSLDFDIRRIPRLPKFKTTLAESLQVAQRLRPEWTQIEAGKEAALSLAQAETLANAPILFLGGQFSADWSPVVDDTPNPYHRDLFNNIDAGVALGLQWDSDIGRARAKRGQADAQVREVEALAKFAESGIPFEVASAHRAVKTAQIKIKANRAAKKAAQKWVAFSLSAFMTGAGDTRDLMEGLGAYAQAQRNDLEAKLGAWIAYNQLLRATGEISQ